MNQQEAKCLGRKCHKKESCVRFTRETHPDGDAFMNWTPYQKTGRLQGHCNYYIKCETLSEGE